MEKRFQIFVSSTFRDLVEERQAVFHALMEMDAIPTGMELFPAANDDAWTLIERVISQSDYYVLVVGGRYGSTGADGISYTEREYDLAVKARIPVLAFLHGQADEIPQGKSELDLDARERLAAFRKKIEDKHHCKYWRGADELGRHVTQAVLRAFTSNPRTGWVRADHGGRAPDSSVQESARPLSRANHTGSARDSSVQHVTGILSRAEVIKELPFAKLTERAQREIYFVGWSCSHVFLPRHRGTFRDFLARDVRLKLLANHPRYLEPIASLQFGHICDTTNAGVVRDVSNGVQTIRDELNKDFFTDQHRARVDFKTTDWLMLWSAVAVDPEGEHGLLQVESYVYRGLTGRSAIDCRPNIVLTRRHAFYDTYWASIKAIWDSGKLERLS